MCFPHWESTNPFFSPSCPHFFFPSSQFRSSFFHCVFVGMWACTCVQVHTFMWRSEDSILGCHFPGSTIYFLLLINFFWDKSLIDRNSTRKLDWPVSKCLGICVPCRHWYCYQMAPHSTLLGFRGLNKSPELAMWAFYQWAISPVPGIWSVVFLICNWRECHRACVSPKFVSVPHFPCGGTWKRTSAGQLDLDALACSKATHWTPGTATSFIVLFKKKKQKLRN